MIHGTTINLYSVGHCWLALCFAFALAFSSFAQDAWQVADVDIVIRRLDSIETITADIRSDVSSINDFVLEIDTSLEGANIFLDDISHDTGDILSRLNNFVFTRKHELLVSDTGLVHVASSIDTKMDRLEQAINNLTNYMCYSSSYVSEWTNISSIVNALIKNQTGYIEDDVFYYLSDILGRPPTEEEISRASDIVQYYGAYPREVLSNISRVSARHLPSGDSWRTFYNSYRNAIFNGAILNDAQNFAEIYYHQYATRDLTSTSIGISNLLSTANQTGITDLDDSISSHTVYDSTGSASHSTTSLFGRVSGQLGKTFGIYGEPAETNDVKKIDSPQLSSQQSTIIADNVQYSINDGCQQVNSTVSGVVDSIFEGRNTSGAFVIPGFSINGYNAGLDDVVIDPSDYNLSHAGLRWFFNAVRALCLVGFVISSLWRIISVESKLNAPDPF